MAGRDTVKAAESELLAMIAKIKAETNPVEKRNLATKGREM
jgi:hypothetical protein